MWKESSPDEADCIDDDAAHHLHTVVLPKRASFFASEKQNIKQFIYTFFFGGRGNLLRQPSESSTSCILTDLQIPKRSHIKHCDWEMSDFVHLET